MSPQHKQKAYVHRENLRGQKTDIVLFKQLVNVSGFAKKWALFEQRGHEASNVTDDGITIISHVTCCDQLLSTLQSVF